MPRSDCSVLHGVNPNEKKDEAFGQSILELYLFNILFLLHQVLCKNFKALIVMNNQDVDISMGCTTSMIY